ncbi:MAG: c-type cytochrome [Nitrospinales bacterium]
MLSKYPNILSVQCKNKFLNGESFHSRHFLLFFLAVFIHTSIGSSLSHAFSTPNVSDAPETLSIDGKSIALKKLINPFRNNSDSLQKVLQEGKEIYFKNCFLCHGDLLNGKGVFSDSLFPPPANFKDPKGILDKPEYYTYWRIAKGGQGLPVKFSPWDSAMPAWENSLSQKEIWRVITFIYETAGEKYDVETTPAISLSRGEELYQNKCSVCHGDTGLADGIAAAYSSPRPRKLSKGHLKIRSTAFGKIPTDWDIFTAITKGLKGGSMPPWKHLSKNDRISLVLYLKTLSKKFAKFKKKGKTHKVITMSSPKPFTLESVVSGKDLFIKNCSGCHGKYGRSDGESIHRIVIIEKDALYPRNLSKPWKFRRGFSREDIFMTIRTGLSLTAMPQFSERMFNDSQIWDIVNYVQTLSPGSKPKIEKTVQAKMVTGELPSNLDDKIWKSAKSYYIPLAGQIIKSPKSYYPTVDSVNIKAIYNDKYVAFRLVWDDPTVDPGLRKSAGIVESPPPPLPPELTIDPDVVEAPVDTEPQKFPDGIALQFPAGNNNSNEKPYFLNGDEKQPVNLWKWNSWPTKAVNQIANGVENIKLLKNGEEISSKISYQYGQYQLLLIRKLSTENKDKEAQFSKEKTIPIAINVWDGTQEETGSKKAISSWFELALQ